MKYEGLNPQIMSLHLPSDKLTLNLTEFRKKKLIEPTIFIDKISYPFDNFYCRFLTTFTLSLFVTIFLVDLTKMMSGQNQGIK